MALSKQLIARMAQMSNTKQGWLDKDPVLYAGEIGIESDTGLVKHGDGVSHWSELAYWSGMNVTYTAAAGIQISSSNVISALLLYEKLRMPNVRIYCHDPNDYSKILAIDTSEPYAVYTDE